MELRVYERRVNNMYIRIGTLARLFLISLGSVAASAIAQVAPTDPNLDTGIKPYETFDRAQENVNIGSGNLEVEIPIYHLPGRAGHDYTVSLTYNSQNWTPVASPVSFTGQQAQTPDPNSMSIAWQYTQPGLGGISIGSTGWQENIPVLYATGVNVPPGCASQNSGCFGVSSYSQSSSYTNFYLVMGDGRQYQFPHASFLNWQTTYTNVGGHNAPVYLSFTEAVPSEDVLIDYDSYIKYGGYAGEGVMLDLTNAASGTGTEQVAVVRFRDGSQILFDMSSFGATQPFCDGSNCSVANANPQTAAVYASAMVDPNGNVINPSGMIGSTGVTGVNGHFLNSNGQPADVTWATSPFPVNSPQTVTPTFQTPTLGGGIMAVNSGLITNMLSSITLADGLQYTFTYNQYGELTEITYPSGGYTRYTYAALPNANVYQWTSAIGGFADRRVVVEKDTCTGKNTAPVQPGYYGTTTPPNTCSVPEEKTTYTNNDAYIAVVDPLGNETDYTFGGGTCSVDPINQPFENLGFAVPATEISRKVYQGLATGGKLLRTVYSNYYSGCKMSLKTAEMTVLPNGTWSETTWTYDTQINSYSTPAVQDHQTMTTSSATAETDNMLVKSEYGFGPGPVPPLVPATPNLPLLRKTVNTYLAQDLGVVNGAIYDEPPIYILNRLQQQTVYDGSGNQVAQTTYTYDSYPGGITTSGAVQHGTTLNSYSSAYTTRGNVTQVSKWTGNSSPPVTTSYQYDDAGNVLQKTESPGETTKYNYSDSWANSACAPSNAGANTPGQTTQYGFAEAFPSSVTNALGQTAHYTWNSCTGTMASATDPNNQTINFAYDLMDRRVRALYPSIPAGQPQTCLQYSDTQNPYCQSLSGGALPIQISMTKLMNASGQANLSTTLLDGLSRVYQTQQSDPYGDDYVQTDYDPAGNTQCVTNPFRSTSAPSYIANCSGYFAVNYQYDALGRKVVQTQQDGTSTLQWCYDGTKVNSQQNASLCAQHIGPQIGDWVDSMDEKGNHWQRVSDALGRLIEVMEPNGFSQAPALETDYLYNTLDDLVSVFQRGNGSTEAPRIRTFSYDALSRLLCASNPENSTASCPATYSGYVPGTTGYSYDSYGNLLTKTDARGVTTNYTYDLLNRLVAKSYTNDPSHTPNTCYQYDVPISSYSDPYPIGRLTAEWTLPYSVSCQTTAQSAVPSNALTATVFIHDAMGHITGEQQYTPAASVAGGKPYTMSYNYDLAGNLTSSTAGAVPSSMTFQTPSAPCPSAPSFSTTTLMFVNCYDTAGRLSSVTSNAGTGPTSLFKVSATQGYWPFGGLWNATYGGNGSGSNGVALSRMFDPRLRITSEADLGNNPSSGTNGSALVTITGAEQQH